jgi:hypothetical protein
MTTVYLLVVLALYAGPVISLARWRGWQARRRAVRTPAAPRA